MAYNKHGYGTHSLYATWHSMLRRCYNPKHSAYKYYGAKGIKVCARWHDIGNFITDVGTKPDGTTLDRIDSSGDYSPSNFRWSNQLEQVKNRDITNVYEFQGKTMTLRQWSKRLGLNENTLKGRITQYGWSVEKAFTTPAYAEMGRKK